LTVFSDTDPTTVQTADPPSSNGHSADDAAATSTPNQPAPTSGIPDFEGEQVWASSGKMVSGTLETGDAVYKMDHYVQVLVTTRVLGVDHVLNEKTGHLTRVHKLKVVEGDVIKSWNPLTGTED
jgi:hypothetical protein